MRCFSDAYAALRRKNKGQYALLAGCSFFSVLLITAYVCMMRSPTILSVLPEGGDSRKQVMMVFVLAVIGCAVFTAYAAGLFFRQKSRETGVFLALGATRRQMQKEMGKELAVISLGSCAAGAVLGGPLAWGVWQLFRLFLVDSREMALSFDPQSYLLSLAFAAYVVIMLFFLGGRSIRRTNIIDIVQESHKSEPIREVKRWYGPVGIVLVAVGALAGYLMPSFFVTVLHWYPPEGLTALFYLPALVGMYMILLHTVVNGWRKRHKYRDIIATSMMKFQGRQTVRNMLVMTLLIAGAYFASFYAPMLNTSSAYSFSTRPVDFEYHWRNDQNWPEREEVEFLAEEYDVDITSWTQTGAATLAGDGYVQVEQDNGALGTTYTDEYREIASSATFFSESAWNALTGQNIDLAPGTCANVLDDDGGSDYISGGDVTLVTNMVTGARLSVTPAEPLCFTMLLGSYVLDDGDYAAITAGLTDLWRETWVFFNVADVESSYPFADTLFNTGDQYVLMDSMMTLFYFEKALSEWSKGVYADREADYDKAVFAISVLISARSTGEETLYSFKEAQAGGIIGRIKSKIYKAVTEEYSVTIEKLALMREQMLFADPATYQTVVKSYAVYCPVDVQVADFVLKDGEETEVYNDYGMFGTILNEYNGEYLKVAYLYDDIAVQLNGVGDGVVTCVVHQMEDGALEDYSFTDAAVAVGTVISIPAGYDVPVYAVDDAPAVMMNDDYIPSPEPEVGAEEVVDAVGEVVEEETNKLLDSIREFFQKIIDFFKKLFGID